MSDRQSRSSPYAALRPTIIGNRDLFDRAKSDQQYDNQLAARQWIELTLGIELPCSDLQMALGDGVVLCQLINRLRPGMITNISRKDLPFVKMENISTFLEAARQLGLDNSDLFQTVDLYEGKDIPAVTHTILTLARVVAGHYPVNRRGMSLPDAGILRNNSSLQTSIAKDEVPMNYRVSGIASTGRSIGKPQTKNPAPYTSGTSSLRLLSEPIASWVNKELPPAPRPSPSSAPKKKQSFQRLIALGPLTPKDDNKDKDRETDNDREDNERVRDGGEEFDGGSAGFIKNSFRLRGRSRTMSSAELKETTTSVRNLSLKPKSNKGDGSSGMNGPSTPNSLSSPLRTSLLTSKLINGAERIGTNLAGPRSRDRPEPVRSVSTSSHSSQMEKDKDSERTLRSRPSLVSLKQAFGASKPPSKPSTKPSSKSSTPKSSNSSSPSPSPKPTKPQKSAKQSPPGRSKSASLMMMPSPSTPLLTKITNKAKDFGGLPQTRTRKSTLPSTSTAPSPASTGKNSPATDAMDTVASNKDLPQYRHVKDIFFDMSRSYQDSALPIPQVSMSTGSARSSPRLSPLTSFSGKLGQPDSPAWRVSRIGATKSSGNEFGSSNEDISSKAIMKLSRKRSKGKQNRPALVADAFGAPEVPKESKGSRSRNKKGSATPDLESPTSSPGDGSSPTSPARPSRVEEIEVDEDGESICDESSSGVSVEDEEDGETTPSTSRFKVRHSSFSAVSLQKNKRDSYFNNTDQDDVDVNANPSPSSSTSSSEGGATPTRGSVRTNYSRSSSRQSLGRGGSGEFKSPDSGYNTTTRHHGTLPGSDIIAGLRQASSRPKLSQHMRNYDNTPSPISIEPKERTHHRSNSSPPSSPFGRLFAKQDIKYKELPELPSLSSSVPERSSMGRKNDPKEQIVLVDENGEIEAQYQLGNSIGKGQFGAVYRALNAGTGQIVAVKRIRLEGTDTDEIDSLMQEVELLKSLSHFNIVKYEGFMRTVDTLNIILEYVENGSLYHTLKVFGNFSEKLVASYCIRILDGLIYLHARQVVHCDLKAANILTTKSGNVKLTDFGVSLNLKLRDADAGVVAGTPNWMAPEVIQLKGASTASDIWSLGCTIIELLTGKPPYSDLISMSALFRIVEDDHPPLPDGISVELEDFLYQCFSKRPEDRPSALQLQQHEWIQKYRTAKHLRSQENLPMLRHDDYDDDTNESFSRSEINLRNVVSSSRKSSIQYNDNDDDEYNYDTVHPLFPPRSTTPQISRSGPGTPPGTPPIRTGSALSMKTTPPRSILKNSGPVSKNASFNSDRVSISSDHFRYTEHRFVKTSFGKAVECKVCWNPLKKHALFCDACSLICHEKCKKDCRPCVGMPSYHQPLNDTTFLVANNGHALSESPGPDMESFPLDYRRASLEIRGGERMERSHSSDMDHIKQPVPQRTRKISRVLSQITSNALTNLANASLMDLRKNRSKDMLDNASLASTDDPRTDDLPYDLEYNEFDSDGEERTSLDIDERLRRKDRPKNGDDCCIS